MSSEKNRQPVEINAGRNRPKLEIVWDDDHRTTFTVNQLRAICPCATCREEREKASKDKDKPIPLGENKDIVANSPQGSKRRSLPMFKAEKYQIANMNYVGNYALGINWEDKHQSIFPWAMLSLECPCAECSAVRPPKKPGE